ncbi:MAG: hypothetical protein Kow0025_17430 [Thermodesulfovibrionales bacterium]
MIMNPIVWAPALAAPKNAIAATNTATMKERLSAITGWRGRGRDKLRLLRGDEARLYENCLQKA